MRIKLIHGKHVDQVDPHVSSDTELKCGSCFYGYGSSIYNEEDTQWKHDNEQQWKHETPTII